MTAANNRVAERAAAISNPAAQVATIRRFGAWYVAQHLLMTLTRYWPTVLTASIGNPVLFLLGLGTGLAVLVNQQQGSEGIAGVGYLQFVAPALLVTAGVNVAVEQFMYPIFGGFKWNPIFLGMNATAISPWQIMFGNVIAATARIAFASTAYLVFVYAFGVVSTPYIFSALLLVPISVLASLALGMPISAYVARLKDDRGQLGLLQRFVVMPLLLFSGTYYPLSVMPAGLQWIGWLSPVWHGSELGRIVTYGYAVSPWMLAFHICYPLALIAVSMWPAGRAFERRLRA